MVVVVIMVVSEMLSLPLSSSRKLRYERRRRFAWVVLQDARDAVNDEEPHGDDVMNDFRSLTLLVLCIITGDAWHPIIVVVAAATAVKTKKTKLREEDMIFFCVNVVAGAAFLLSLVVMMTMMIVAVGLFALDLTVNCR
jgi:hypothetical protein